MKVLVVDDDIVARKVLNAFLKQSNYEIQLAEDGLSAFRAMTATDAPLVAIVDWSMPDLSGPELCAKLRAHDFEVQPFLIVLTARKEKADIAAALDAGADDFITKPFNIQEMQARLRAATRAVNRQLALHRRIAALEEALHRREPPAPKPAPEPPAAEASRRIVALEHDQIDTVVAGALRHSGQPDAPRRTAQGPAAPRVMAWAALLVTNRETWFDLLLETDCTSVATLFAQARGRPSIRPGELAAFCATMQTALRDSMQSVLRAMGGEVLAPLPPLAIGDHETSAPPPDNEFVERHHYNIGHATVTLVICAHPSPLRQKPTEQLQLSDVLAAPYPPPGTHHVPLLRGGVVLNEHFVEKLQLFAHATAGDLPPVPVHTPSALALHYARATDAANLAGAPA